MLASAGTVFDAVTSTILWLVILAGILFFGFICLLYKYEQRRHERDELRDRGRGFNIDVKERIRRGELGPGGYPIRKKRGKK